MANFTQAVVRKLENGYVVSITKLDVGERGLQPVETHNIANNDAEVLTLLELGEKTASAIAL